MPDQAVAPGGGQRPKLAVVIQRYGAETGGGSELHCQVLAERLCRYYEIEILTTCAQDHRTWKNHYRPGLSILNGISVRRFPVAAERDTRRFGRLYDKIFWREHASKSEIELLTAQGPYAPELLSYIEKQQGGYNAFLFFTYLYYPTCFGLPLVGSRAVFQPTTHDEPLLYLDYFDTVFHATPYLIFNSEEERHLVQRRFSLPLSAGRVVGVGVDNQEPPPDEAGWSTLQRRLGDAKVITYVGRVEGGKGCEALIEYFLKYRQQEPDRQVKLLLMGRQSMEVPTHPDIVAPGFVSEFVKGEALRASTVMVAPSAFESLCLAALECWWAGRPVLANGACPVLVGHCMRSNGGLWYRDYEEFHEALNRLLGDDALARALGAQGREYVRVNYTWARIEKLYCEVLNEAVASAPIFRAAGDASGATGSSPERR